jgi:hypothetical protein
MPPPSRVPSKRTLAPQPAPVGLYLSTYDPELGAAICRRVAAGESLRAICGADASMPTGKTVWNWRRAHKEFRWMLEHAQAVARGRALAAQGAADAARRAERAGARKAVGRTGRPSSFDAADWDEIRARLMGGEGLTAICRDPHMPAVGTVYNWMRARPELVEAYRLARSLALDGLLERACDRLVWEGERKSWPKLNRTVRATEKRAARLKLKRYAEPQGPQTVTFTLEEPDGTRRVIYGGPVD